MSDGGLQDIVDSLAGRLGRSVAIDDPVLHLVAASHHFGDEDHVRVSSLLSREMPAANREFVMSHGVAQWTGAGRVAANPDFGAKARVCVPIRRLGRLLGFLWLIDDDESLTPDEVADSERVATAAGRLLARGQVSRERDRARDEATLRDLFSEDPDRRARAHRSIHAEHHAVGPPSVVVMVLDVQVEEAAGECGAEVSATLRSCTEEAGRAVALAHALCLVEGRRAVVLLSTAQGQDAPPYAAYGERVLANVDAALGAAATCVLGAGSAEASLSDARACFEQACQAARAGTLLPDLGPLVEWDRLGVYGMLLHLVPPDPSTTVYPAPVARLLGTDPAGRLLATAETYLDEACSAPRTAALLRIHRTTLYYRLNRLQEIAAVDLDDGEDRLTLHLGIKLARLAGAVPNAVSGT